MGGGTASLDGANDPARSEWYAVCSNFGEDDTPYLLTDRTFGDCSEVEGVVRCSGGVAGVFDMLGRDEVEWTRECQRGWRENASPVVTNERQEDLARFRDALEQGGDRLSRADRANSRSSPG